MRTEPIQRVWGDPHPNQVLRAERDGDSVTVDFTVRVRTHPTAAGTLLGWLVEPGTELDIAVWPRDDDDE